MRLNLNDYQNEKIRLAHEEKKNVTIILKPYQIGQGNPYNLTDTQINRLKKAKQENKEVRLELEFKQIKEGGFLPHLFGGIAAAAAAAQGGSAIWDSYTESKHKKAMEKETIRHNQEVEKIIYNVKTLQIGSGLKRKKNNQKVDLSINFLVKKYGEKALSNFDILKFTKKNKYFRACFMRNELPLKPWTNESGILNLNDSNDEGSHWVAWVKEGNLKIYFDSYGEFNPPTELVNYLGKKNLLIINEYIPRL